MANRVTAIRAASTVFQWKYVSTALNPADKASRGVSADMFLKSKAWISGPDFLVQPESGWPVTPDQTPTADDPEVKRTAVVNTLSAEQDAVNQLISHYSEWHRLTKAIVWILKVKNALKQSIFIIYSTKCKKRVAPQVKKDEESQKDQLKWELAEGSLRVEDLQQAEIEIIQFCQQRSFSEEIAALKTGLMVKRSSHLHMMKMMMC